MRSFASTFLLAILAVLILGLAVLQWQEGSFESLFGKPVTPVGNPLYTDFKAQKVTHIRVSTGNYSAAFSLTENGWYAEHPWQDRMDPMAAVAIIQFSLGMRVEDHAPANKVDPAKSGLGENCVHILLEDSEHQALAHYKLGKITPWTGEHKETGAPLPTLFIQPQDPGRSRHTYICTGDITPLFKDGLRYLRDHRPFYFDPRTIETINIQSSQGNLTLGRLTPQSPWRITKPLELSTDLEAMRTLLEGLYNLRAMKVSDRNEITLPATTTTGGSWQISITPFGAKSPTTLELYPAESFDSKTVKAVVNDRPNTVFELPLKPNPDLISIPDLPVDVNSLRDTTLTHIDQTALNSIRIIPATANEVMLTRRPGDAWKVVHNGNFIEANEENLFKLLKAVTAGRAIGFESDAATDFSPWGLDRPILRLHFTDRNQNSLELRFGMNVKGETFVNRTGSPSVMKIEHALLKSIAIQPYEWKHERIWSLNRVDLQKIVLKRAHEEALELEYTFNPEGWKAMRGSENLSATINPSRVNFMLTSLEGLRSRRWLASDDSTALTALANPELSITALERTIDDEGEDNGFQIRTIRFAPVTSGPDQGMIYGSLNSEPHPFLLDPDTYRKITTNLFED